MSSSYPPYDETTANQIVGSEQILTLWKKFNNVINALPSDGTASEMLFYKKNLLLNNILNKSIPIKLVNNSNPNIVIKKLDGPTFATGPSYRYSNFTVENLNTYFDTYFNDNPSHNRYDNYKCVIPGYDYLEFYYKCECYPAVTTMNSNGTTIPPQYQTWFVPMPNSDSGGTIDSLKSNPNQTNLLTNTVKKLYDPTLRQYTYKYKIFLKNTSASGSYVEKAFAEANSFYAFIFEDTGILSFFGGNRNGSNLELNANNVEVKNVDGFRPRLSYIRYVGPTGFDDAELSGNIVVDGSLNINGDLNISGGNIFIDRKQVNFSGNVNGVSDWDDLSLSNLDLSGNLRFKVSDTSYITLIAPSDLSASYTLKLPKAQGISGDILALDSSQQLIFTNQNGNSNSQNFLNNIQSKTLFSFDISYLVIDSSLHDLSNIFFNTITPSKTNSQIFVDFNFLYKCSYAFEERITIQIYRDNCDNHIQSDETLGSTNFTGGLIGKYSGSFIDTPNTTTQVKYYIKFKLENNNSETRQGIYKFNSITLIEY